MQAFLATDVFGLWPSDGHVRGNNVSSYLTKRSKSASSRELAASLLRMQETLKNRRDLAGPKPARWEKPPYGTPAYRRACDDGWISAEEAENDQRAHVARSELAKQHHGVRAVRNPRLDYPHPPKSRQYVRSMATTWCHDRGLRGEAKALLPIIVAFCGRGRHCDTTKSFLATRMMRSSRSILRYLTDLIERGYIKTEVRRNMRGMDVGLRIWITQAALPFFAEDGPLATWLAETSDSPAKLGRTERSYNNDSSKISFLSSLFLTQKTRESVP